MAVKYDFFKSPQIDSEQEEDYHIRIVDSRTTETEQVVEKIRQSCTYTEADIIGCLAALSKVLQTELADGNRVKLNGVGTFSLSVHGKVSPKDNGQFKLSDAEVRTINFRPDSTLMKSIRNEVHFVCSPHFSSISKPLSQEELYDRLRNFFKEKTVINTAEFVSLSQQTLSTAKRTLVKFVAHGVLEKVGRGVYISHL